MSTQKLSIECRCNSPEHTFTFMMDDDPDWDDVYLYVHLNKLPFWRRVLYVIRYVFGYRSKYGCFDEVVMGQPDLDKLQSFINRVRDAKAQARSPGLPQEEWIGEPGDHI